MRGGAIAFNLSIWSLCSYFESKGAPRKTLIGSCAKGSRKGKAVQQWSKLTFSLFSIFAYRQMDRVTNRSFTDDTEMHFKNSQVLQAQSPLLYKCLLVQDITLGVHNAGNACMWLKDFRGKIFWLMGNKSNLSGNLLMTILQVTTHCLRNTTP